MRILSILSLFLIPILSFGQDETVTDFFRKESRNEKYEAGAPVLFGFVAPAYHPDLGFCLSGRAELVFKTKRNNDYLSHSRMPLALDANFSGDLRTRLSLRSNWYDDLLTFDLDLQYKNLKNHYWGIGMGTNQEVEKDDITTVYHLTSLQITPRLLFNLPLHLQAGLIYDYRKSRAVNLSDLMKEDLTILQDGTALESSGIGLLAAFDTRQGMIPQRHALSLTVSGIFYDDFLGSAFRYTRLILDYSHYLPVIRQGSVLAWHVLQQSSFGDIPWEPLPALDKDEYLLRGIFPGRYRDKNSSLLVVEYRHGFLQADTDIPSRHSVTFWLGAGTVYPSLAEIKQLIAATGVGYRYALGPDTNLRIDVGFGTENVALYIELNEAF